MNVHVVKSLGVLLCVDTFMTLKVKTTHTSAGNGHGY